MRGCRTLANACRPCSGGYKRLDAFDEEDGFSLGAGSTDEEMSLSNSLPLDTIPGVTERIPQRRRGRMGDANFFAASRSK